MRVSAIRLAVLLAVLLAAAPASAQVALDTFKEHETALPAGASAAVVAEVPFHLAQDGSLYVKLLPTPWNAINNGTPNGTVSADHREGLSGWHVRFTLADGNGTPLAEDGLRRPLAADLGVYADATATAPVYLKGDRAYTLLANISMPAAAATPNATHRVVFALVFREGDATASDGSSGGRFEQSRAFMEILRITGGGDVVVDPVTDPDPDAVPDPTNGTETPGIPIPGSSVTTGTSSGTSGGDPAKGPVPVIIYVPAQPELAWLIPLATGVAILSLLVAALTLGLVLYLMVHLKRDRLG